MKIDTLCFVTSQTFEKFKNIEKKKHTKELLLEDILHHLGWLKVKTQQNDGKFTISTGDRRISEPSTLSLLNES